VTDTLGYDLDEQLTTINVGDTPISSFQYDALGRRVSRTDYTVNPPVTTNFLFGGNQPLAQNSGSGWTQQMTPGNDLIQIGGAQPIYDMQGNQRAVMDSTQTVTATQVYDAFGDQIGGTGTTASALQWQGGNLHATYAADAGFILAGARYYDPQVGRFITRDTDLGQHPHIYCAGDPVYSGDPSGHGIKEFLRYCWVGDWTIFVGLEPEGRARQRG